MASATVAPKRAQSNGNGATKATKPKETAATNRNDTQYVILEAVETEEFGRVWVERHVDKGYPGRKAIKSARQRKDTPGIYDPGVFKAVNKGNWDAEVNNLTIKTAVQEVSSFE